MHDLPIRLWLLAAEVDGGNFWLNINPQTGNVRVLGVPLVGVNARTGQKLLFTLIFVVVLTLLGRLFRWIAGRVFEGRRDERAAFWTRQGINLTLALLALVGLTSLWFDDPTRLAQALGLVTAGLAFALQKVVTAIAGYFVILRGKTFNVGDRITMGGVRGDVIALSFIQTTIMEMGQPPTVQDADPAMWVRSRQFTGRIVTVSNARIFDDPVYNYTREFPYIWEEMQLPISFTADRGRAEQILLDAAARHAVDAGRLDEDVARELRRQYAMEVGGLGARVYYRLTDNWLELTVRFLANAHGVRELKDAMSREIITRLDEAGIGIASATFEIVGVPPLRLERARGGNGIG